MAIQTPGKRPAKRFLKSKVMSGKFGKGRKGTNSDLQLTSMVDMFTLLVIFLLANFSATGDVLFMSKEIQLPTASHGSEIERAPVVAITDNFIGLEGQKVVDVDQIAHDEILNIQALEDNLRDLKKREEFVHQLDKDHQFAGKINIQGADSIILAPSEINTPQLVSGSWMPSPRKDRKLSIRITSGTVKVT